MDDKRITRRTFIQTGAAGTALIIIGGGCGNEPPDTPPAQPTPAPTATPTAAATPAPTAAEPDPAAALKLDGRPFKAALIGCGEQGRFLMREAIKIPGVEFTALCDINPDNLKQAQAIAGDKAKTFADHKQLLKEGDFQGVIVATPLDTHFPIVMEALENNRHVLVERTMADTIPNCQAIANKVVEKQCVLLVGNHLRFNATYQDAYKFIANGEVGQVKSITVFWRQKSLRRKPATAAEFDPKPFGYADADQWLNWRLYKEHSGGIMTEEINDQLDAVNLLLDDKAFPTTVTGAGATKTADGRTVIDDVDLTYQYPDGMTLKVVSNLEENFLPQGWEIMEIVEGTKGRLVLAQNARVIGIFAAKPDAERELWYDLANKNNDITDPQLVPPGTKETIVLGKPTPGIVFIAGFDIANLLHPKTYQPMLSSWTLELLEFKTSVLDGQVPKANAMTGLASAALSLLGLQAAQSNGTPVPIPASALVP